MLRKALFDSIAIGETTVVDLTAVTFFGVAGICAPGGVWGGRATVPPGPALAALWADARRTAALVLHTSGRGFDPLCAQHRVRGVSADHDEGSSQGCGQSKQSFSDPSCDCEGPRSSRIGCPGYTQG